MRVRPEVEVKIRSIADIRKLEASGIEAVYPQLSPHKILEASAAQWPDKPAILYLHDASDPIRDETVSYAELLARVEAAASLFRVLGAVRGKSVAILSTHTLSSQIALWGAQLVGCACPINPMLRAEHIANLLKASDAALIVAMGVNEELDFWSSMVPALRQEGVTLPILDCDASASCPGSDGCFEALLAQHLSEPMGFEVEGDDHATASLYHTGGTTGAPKLVHHSRANEAHVARSCALLHDYSPEDVVVNGFPLFHVAGAFVYGLSVLSSGATLVIPGRLGMRNKAFMGSFWHQVERLGVTVLGAVPTVLSGLLASSIEADISSMRVALTGGSPLPPELADSFEQKTGVPVRNILGMTETSGAIALESVHADRVALSCGYPLPFMVVAIIPHGDAEPDLSQRLEVGETGIVVVRGPNVSSGYTEAERNAGTFLEGGWLVSGNLGRLDEEGRLYITGRAKDVIIRGSHNIDPQSIEDALLAHPDVEVAAAVGMPDSYAGELPVAFVTLHGGSIASPDALLDFLRHRIEEPAAMPKRVEIIDEMPLTPIGKIFKPSLRKIAIRWAIEGAAVRAGVGDQIAVEIDDKLNVTLSASESCLAKLREQLVGMPVSIEFQVKES